MPELEIFKGDLLPQEYWGLKFRRNKVARWRSGEAEGYSTGFHALDYYRRLVNGELTVVAGRPSQGKTAIAMQMVEKVARSLKHSGDEGCCAIFSAEMSGEDLHMRCAAALCGVSTHKLQQGQGTEAEFQAIEQASETIGQLPIWIDDNSRPNTSQMLTQLRNLNEDVPIRMMMFDFLELGGDGGSIEHLRVGNIAQNLKGIAKTLNIPVIALSQLNRDVEDRANKIPTLSDLRQSGMVEQISDVVMFIMRPEYYVERNQPISVPEQDKRGVAYVQYAKNRNGPVGLARLAFIKERILFGDLQRNEVLPGVRR